MMKYSRPQLIVETGTTPFYLKAAFQQAEDVIRQWKLNRNLYEIHPQIISSVICSASYLEASVNSLCTLSFAPFHKTKLAKVPRKLWKSRFDRTETLAKYQTVLAVVQKKPFDEGMEPFQSVKALIRLRNYIAHPKAIWSQGRETENLRKLLGGKYRFSPKELTENNAFFPMVCLSPQCALWAVSSASEFVEKFYKKLPASAQLPFLSNEVDIGRKARKLLDDSTLL